MVVLAGTVGAVIRSTGVAVFAVDILGAHPAVRVVGVGVSVTVVVCAVREQCGAPF